MCRAPHNCAVMQITRLGPFLGKRGWGGVGGASIPSESSCCNERHLPLGKINTCPGDSGQLCQPPSLAHLEGRAAFPAGRPTGRQAPLGEDSPIQRGCLYSPCVISSKPFVWKPFYHPSPKIKTLLEFLLFLQHRKMQGEPRMKKLL